MTAMESDRKKLDAVKWIVTRIDGKIASVSTDWKGFGRVAAAVSSWPAGKISEITCGKISTEELFSLAKTSVPEDFLLIGTPFQKRVWMQLYTLMHPAPDSFRLYSYSDFAEMCGNLPGVRAIAHAVGQNPLPVIIPCHLIVPKETTDKIAMIEKEAETTLFGKEGLRFDKSFDFGHFSCPGGKLLKRSLILRQSFSPDLWR